METFKATWHADDGYVCGDRPKTLMINSTDIEGDMSDEEVADLLNEIVQSDFNERVSPVLRDRDAVLAWMKAQRDAAKERGDG